ncbi:hypothetical protein GCM10020227_57650 [Streptomyces flavovirens]
MRKRAELCDGTLAASSRPAGHPDRLARAPPFADPRRTGQRPRAGGCPWRFPGCGVGEHRGLDAATDARVGEDRDRYACFCDWSIVGR